MYFLPKRALGITMLLCIGFFSNSFAQNCSVNADVDQTICSNQALTLPGNVTLPFSAPTLLWTQVSGPPVTFATPNSTTTAVTGYLAGNVYRFRLNVRCGDGQATFDEVQITVNGPNTIPNAGPDQSFCKPTNAGNFNIALNANAPAGGETGTWSVVSGGAGTFSPNANTPNATFALSTDVCTQSTQLRLRWTLARGICNASDEVVYTVNSGVTTVSAGANQSTTCGSQITLAGSCPGSSPQAGAWSVVSGPTTPSFGNINSPSSSLSNLVTGSYVLRWTVSGPCASGNSTVTVTVNAAVPPVITAGGNQTITCNNTATLNGTAFNAPQQGQWTIISGPVGGVFGSPNSSSTSFNNLQNGVYVVQYSITGPCFNVTATANITVNLNQAATTASAGSNQTYCINSLPTTVALLGNSLNSGETGQWAFVSGPNAVTFGSPTLESTTISGVSATGTYRMSWTISRGACTSTDAVNVNVVAPFTTVDAGGDQTLACGATTGTLTPLPAGGTWTVLSSPAGSSPAVAGNNFSGFNRGGIYTLQYRFSNVCNSIADIVNIAASQLPSAANAGTDPLMPCNTIQSALAASAPASGTGSWSQVSGPTVGTFSSLTNTNVTVTGLTAGVYTFRWTINGGNTCATTQDDVNVRVSLNTPTGVTAMNNVTVCFGQPIELIGSVPNVGETGVWTQTLGPAVTISNPNSPTATAVLPNANTTYNFRWTVSNNCGSTFRTVIINTNSSQGPSQANAGPDQCQGAVVTSSVLAASAPTSGTGTWTQDSGPAGVTFANANVPNTTATYPGNGTFVLRWTVSVPGCGANFDQVTVTISSPATSSVAGADIDVCGGTTTTLTGNTPASGTGTWSQISGPGGAIFANPNLPNTAVSGLIAGQIYTFRWTISNAACPSGATDDVVVNVYPSAPTSIAGLDITRCNSSAFSLSANNASPGTGTWTYVSGTAGLTIGNINSPTTSVNPTSSGIARLRWTISTAPACLSSIDEVDISVTFASVQNNNQSICEASTAPLVANDPGAGTGTWTRISGPAATIASAGSRITSANLTGGVGAYVFRWTVSGGGCANSTADVTVTNNAAPTSPNAGPDQTACPSPTVASVTMAGNAIVSGTGNWTRVSGPGSVTIASSNTPNTAITNMSPGLHQFRWTSTNGSCVEFDDIFVSVYSLTQPNAGADQLVCSASVSTFTGNAPSAGVGTWTQVGATPAVANIASPNLANSAVTNMTVTGLYTFRWTIVNGPCSQSDDVLVRVSTFPSPTATSSKPIYCAGETVQLFGSGGPVGSTYAWSGPNSFSLPNTQNPTIANSTPAATGNYIVTVTNADGCASAVAGVSVTVNQPPVIASNTGPYCNGQSIQLIATASTAVSFAWTGPNSFSSTTQNNTITNSTNAMSGVYTITVTDATGCTSTASTSLTSNPNPTVIAGNGGPYCAGNTIALNSSGAGTGASYSWAGPSSFSSSSQNPTRASATTAMAGIYTVTGTNAGGCSASVPTTVIVNDRPTVQICVAQSDVCLNGAGRFTVTPSGGLPPYTVSWLPNNGSTSPPVGVATSGGTATLLGMQGGTNYTFTVVDANGCAVQ